MGIFMRRVPQVSILRPGSDSLKCHHVGGIRERPKGNYFSGTLEIRSVFGCTGRISGGNGF